MTTQQLLDRLFFLLWCLNSDIDMKVCCSNGRVFDFGRALSAQKHRQGKELDFSLRTAVLMAAGGRSRPGGSSGSQCESPTKEVTPSFDRRHPLPARFTMTALTLMLERPYFH